MLRIQLFGPVRVWRDDVEVALGGAQTRGVLAVLALAGGPVSRSRLLDALWPGDVPRTAWNIVQTHVKRLRAALEPDRHARGASAVLPLVGDGYALRLAPGAVDAVRFRDLVAQARVAGDRAVVLRLLEAADRLWTDAPLADLPALAGLPALMSLRAERWAAAAWHVDAALALGRGGEVVAVAEEAAEGQPFDEPAQARLVRVYQAAGRRADAFAVFRRARVRLAEGLGADPGPELLDAQRHLLASTTAPAQPAVAVVTAAAVPPVELPPDVADFTGRAAQVEQVRAALRGGSALPVAVLTGLGGAGKTTLAVHVAHRLAAEYPDGQLYACLRGKDTGAVLGRFLTALGVAGPALPEGVEARAALWRSRLAGRRVLVLLDDAAWEGQVRPLLPGVATCAVLVTSRARLLGLAGARTVELDGLPAAEAAALFGAVAGAGRVAAERAATGRVIASCAGLPLALRIAAVRLAARPDWTVARLAARLGDERRCLDELSAGDLAVRASLALSYAALAGPARRALRLVALLDVPDVPAPVVAALLGCSVAAAETLLEGLVDAHLLRTTRDRYAAHDLVRLFARERAGAEDPPQEQRAALTRAFGAWLHLAEQACLADGRYLTRLPGPAPRHDPGWAADPGWFDAERAAVLSAVTQASALGLAALAWNLADAVVGWYETRDLYDDYRQTHERALAACLAAGDRLGAAVMHRNLAHLNSPGLSSRIGAVTGHARAAQTLFQAVGEPRGAADALILRGEVHAAAGRPEPARRLMSAGLALAERHGHRLGAAAAHNELGMLARTGGRPVDSAASLLAALELGNSRQRYTSMRFLGLLRADEGLHQQAAEHMRAALALAESLGSRTRLAQALRSLAQVYTTMGRPEARGLLQRSGALVEALGWRAEEAFVLMALGRLDLADGEPGRAVQRLTAAVEAFDGSAVAALARTLHSLGDARLALGDRAGAATAWRRSRRHYAALGNMTQVAALSRLMRGPRGAALGAPGAVPGRLQC